VIAEAARIQALLEGVPLPAKTKELVRYAAAQRGGAAAASALRRLPEREFSSLDEVGEAIAPVQPAARPKQSTPRETSGEPPGAEAYLDPAAEPGSVRKRGG
jgi:uncharacterized protein DUF2795